MNADGSAGVSATVAAGAELPILTGVWIALFVLAGIALVAGGILLAFTLMARSRRTA